MKQKKFVAIQTNTMIANKKAPKGKQCVTSFSLKNLLRKPTKKKKKKEEEDEIDFFFFLIS